MPRSDELSGVLSPRALENVQDRIAAAQERGDHGAAVVTIVAVTKAFPVTALVSGYEAGLRTFGESRVQEAAGKLPTFSQRGGCEVRLIGHLQSNKAKTAVELFDLIESVDSIKLLRRLDRLAGEAGKVMPVYLQVNAGRDEAKFGFDPDELPVLAGDIMDAQYLQVNGIMTIAPLTGDEQILRDCFRATRQSRDVMREDIPTCMDLSMGMTDDFEIAVEEGATHVRIGRALFGERPPR
ncbi:MAG: YggS family pyridoxal phosphate-dependent enzyme [Fidelibacterota bacterium]|nr:MAG: YggS family pyridoxal phosphate-dependent enzyme [Candidatus Neomarinimicrobiota bacterium]